MRNSLEACGYLTWALLTVAGCRSTEPAPELGQVCGIDGGCPKTAVCHWGYCRAACGQDGDCTGVTEACIEGACEPVANPECRVAGDCATPGICETREGATCSGRRCQYPALAVGAACDDGDGCTHGDLCDASGICAGALIPCDLARPPECLACDLTGDPVGSARGHCVADRCVECTTPAECTAPAGGPLVCFDATCPSERCVYTPRPGTVCQTARCADGTLYDQEVCTATGACPGGSGTSCDGYRCDVEGLACRITCGGNDNCMPDYFCTVSSTCTPTLPDGGDCDPGGNAACQSGYCDGSFCCASGTCCGQVDDCPSTFAAAPVCLDDSPTTPCQGERLDPACVEHQCGSVTVDDDSGCAGQRYGCGSFAPVTCGSATNQSPPVCGSSCSGVATGCAPGYVCQAAACDVPLGAGTLCTGTGQGTCVFGQKCDNAICCANSPARCCTATSACPNGLTCDAAAYTCHDTCNNFDDSRCADSGTFCLNDACITKLAVDEACVADAQCLLGHCVDGKCASG